MSKKYRVNEQIREQEVTLILEDGHMYGEVPLNVAIKIGNEKNLDIVEVSPPRPGKLSICKLMDYGKMMYQEAKHKKVKKEVMKEIRIGLNISDHDLEVKNKKVKEFLAKGYKVKYSMMLKGREMNLKSSAGQKMLLVLEQFVDIAKWDKIKSNGRNLVTILKPA